MSEKILWYDGREVAVMDLTENMIVSLLESDEIGLLFVGEERLIDGAKLCVEDNTNVPLEGLVSIHVPWDTDVRKTLVQCIKLGIEIHKEGTHDHIH